MSALALVPAATTDLSSWEVLGLPFHALVVHATTVVLPLTTLLLVLCAFSARVRARAGAVLPIAGVVSLVLVPLSTSSGEALERHLPPNPLIEAHAHAADGLLPWAIALAVASVVVWLTGLGRNPYKGGRPRHAVAPLSLAVAVAATAVAVGTSVQVVHIGHLGAEAAWSGVMDRSGS